MKKKGAVVVKEAGKMAWKKVQKERERKQEVEEVGKEGKVEEG